MKRKVISAEDRGSGKWYALELECGHVVARRDKGKGAPPLSVQCDLCECLLDRLRMADDWKTAQQLKSSKDTLRFMYGEGTVDCSVGPRNVGTFWRLKK